MIAIEHEKKYNSGLTLVFRMKCVIKIGKIRHKTQNSRITALYDSQIINMKTNVRYYTWLGIISIN